MLDQLLSGSEASAAFDQGGLLDQLKKALAERALNAEMDHHLHTPQDKSMEVIGKADRVDARMPSELGARLAPAQTAPLPPGRRALQAQATRRRLLVEMRKQEVTRLQQTTDPMRAPTSAASSSCLTVASSRSRRG